MRRWRKEVNMSFYQVNLAACLNHRMVYEGEVSSPNAGLEGLYTIRNRFYEGNLHPLVNGIPFALSAGEFDNVSACGQVVPVNQRVTRIHVLGFSYWGSFNELLVLQCADGTSAEAEIILLDLSTQDKLETNLLYCHFYNCYDHLLDGGRFPTFGTVQISASCHHSVCTLPEPLELAEIVLPENPLMHILAITVEG